MFISARQWSDASLTFVVSHWHKRPFLTCETLRTSMKHLALRVIRWFEYSAGPFFECFSIRENCFGHCLVVELVVDLCCQLELHSALDLMVYLASLAHLALHLQVLLAGWLPLIQLTLLRNTTMWSQLTSTHLVPLAMNYSLVHLMQRHLLLVNSSISLTEAEMHHNGMEMLEFTMSTCFQMTLLNARYYLFPRLASMTVSIIVINVSMSLILHFSDKPDMLYFIP